MSGYLFHRYRIRYTNLNTNHRALLLYICYPFVYCFITLNINSKAHRLLMYVLTQKEVINNMLSSMNWTDGYLQYKMTQISWIHCLSYMVNSYLLAFIPSEFRLYNFLIVQLIELMFSFFYRKPVTIDGYRRTL